MNLWAIVPVKPLRRGKSRLAGVLSEDERAELNRRLLVHTLQTLTDLPEIEQILVVSRDTAALAAARAHGARTLMEHGTPQLNLALTRATLVARGYGAQGVLILPADLPLVGAPEIRALLGRIQQPPVVVIAPDRHRQGTNSLLVWPAGLLKYQFGPGSYQLHCEQARQAGARLEVVELPSLALDMDLPEDLDLVSAELSGIEVDLEAYAHLHLPGEHDYWTQNIVPREQH